MLVNAKKITQNIYHTTQIVREKLRKNPKEINVLTNFN